MSDKKLTLIIFFLLLISCLSLISYYLYFRRSSLLRGDDINLVSDIDGINFELKNKIDMILYLDEFGFWEGVVDDFKDPNQVDYIKPKTLVIHLSDQEFEDNKTSWTGGIYAAATKSEIRSGREFHLWISVNKGFFDGTYSGLERWLDNKFLTGIFTRSMRTRLMSETVLENHIKVKMRREKFFTVENKRL